MFYWIYNKHVLVSIKDTNITQDLVEQPRLDGFEKTSTWKVQCEEFTITFQYRGRFQLQTVEM